MKEKIRPIYSELQGYLSQAPELKNIYDQSPDQTLWDQVNGAIDELNNISGKDYIKFKLKPEYVDRQGTFPHYAIDISAYRSKLGGLIARLHGEYFSDESVPFSGMPSTIINQNQSQNQTQSITLFLEIQEKIISEIPKHKEESKERNFLEKIKSVLPTLKTATDIFSSILKIGSEFGFSAADISKLIHF